jgi:hypothetical protein
LGWVSELPSQTLLQSGVVVGPEVALEEVETGLVWVMETELGLEREVTIIESGSGVEC